MKQNKYIDNLLKNKRIKQLWKWWVIENWKDAVDIGVKLTAIIGAIVATNLFVLKPDLTWSGSIQILINLDKVQSIYIAENIPFPHQLVEEINFINNGSVSTSRSSTSVFDWEESHWFSNNLYLLMKNYSENDWESSYFSNSGLSNEEVAFAINAIDKSSYAEVSIELSNHGQAAAKNIRVMHPNDLKLIGENEQGFVLFPGQTKILTLKTTDLTLFLGNTEIVYDEETSLLINHQTLGLICIFFIVLWFSVITLSLIYKYFTVDE